MLLGHAVGADAGDRGSLHPRFREGSDSLNIRNGVGTSGGRVARGLRHLEPAGELPRLRRLFRDGLGLPDALYFDGRVSRLHAPGLGRRT
jgi:uncharacterized protein YigE (DUF2233 family)